MNLPIDSLPTIFCPNNHLVLEAAACSRCSWVRPLKGARGSNAWGEVNLGQPLGIVEQKIRAPLGAAGGVAVVQLNAGDLQGLRLADGRLLWRTPLPEGLRLYALTEVNGRALAAIWDSRPFTEAGPGFLALLTEKGELQKVWNSSGYGITGAIQVGEWAVVRQTDGLVGFEAANLSQPRWKRPLQSFTALPLTHSGAAVLLKHGETLEAIEAHNGALRWSFPLGGSLFHLPAVEGRHAALALGEKTLVLLDTGSSSPERWRATFDKIYGPAVITGGRVFAVVKGSKDSHAPDYYALAALDLARGTEVWRIALNGLRAAHLLAAPGNCLLVCDHHGRIQAHSSTDGKMLWKTSLGGTDDYLGTELVLAGSLLLAGTSSGKLSALQLVEETVSKSAAEWLELARRSPASSAAAADAYALGGQFRKAAEIYAGMKEVDRALALYEKAGALREAGLLARTSCKLDLALAYFERFGDLIGQAETLDSMGEHYKAAQLYERAQSWVKAGEQYYKVKMWAEAARCYEAGKDFERAENAREMIAPDENQMRAFIEQGKYAQAVGMARKLKFWEIAAELSREKLRDIQGETSALRSWFDEESSKTGQSACPVLHASRLADLYQQQGQFEEQAGVLQAMGKHAEAGQAYAAAAEQARNLNKPVEERARLLDLAKACFKEDGVDDKEKACREMVYRLRGWPIIISIPLSEISPFTEGGVDILKLKVVNIGYGVARNIEFSVETEFFDIIPKSSTGIKINAIQPEKSSSELTYICLIPKKHGQNVPLRIRFKWQRPDKTWDEGEYKYLAVVNDRQSNQPVQNVTNNYSGPHYDHVEQVNQTAGGDVLNDSAKKEEGGMYANFNHPTGTAANPFQKLAEELSHDSQLCPVCSCEVAQDATYCPACKNTFTRCPQCGKPVAFDHKVCMSCKATLTPTTGG